MALLLALLAGCEDGPAGPAPGEPPVVRIERPGALVRTLEIDLGLADGVEVAYWSSEDEVLMVQSLEPRTHHTVHLARLEPDTRYRFEVRPLDRSRDPASVVDSFTTTPLPEDLERLEFVGEGRPTHPLTVYEITRNEDGYEGVVIIDEEGDVVWYRPGTVGGGTRRENGNFVFKQGDDSVLEVAPTGEVVHELTGVLDPHHDVITTPWNTLYVLAHDEQEIDGETVVGEAIWEWDPDGETLVKRWSAFDHLDYAEDRGQASGPDDWLHANALAIGPGGNVLVSFAFLSQVISIRPDFSGIEWRLGGPNATITASGESEFHHQHTASELPADGGRRVLLFDNGTHARGYSRALELVIDPEAGTAERAWEFVAPNRNHSFIVSLARRLENGNTFVHFGAGPGVFFSKGPVETYEVRPDGTAVWRMEVRGEDVGDQFVLYRAWPVDDLVGETRRESR